MAVYGTSDVFPTIPSKLTSQKCLIRRILPQEPSSQTVDRGSHSRAILAPSPRQASKWEKKQNTQTLDY